MKTQSKVRNHRNKLKVSRNILYVLLPLLILIGICLVGITSYIVFKQISRAWMSDGGILKPSFLQKTSTPRLNALGIPIPDDQIFDGDPLATLVPWEGADRVTLLLLGLDFRDWSTNERASRSDTMILVTLDPQTKSAGILSIPRDLWVSIPGFKHGKINTAYYLGDAYQLPGGGPALAVKTVEQFLGVPINYYAQIDFQAFVRFIDEIGGVEVDVPEPLSIDLLGTGFKTKKKLEPGRQVLPGEWALAYARARYTEGGDFDRAKRQQQVIMGIRDRILTFDMLPSLVVKAPTLFKELSSGVRTNLSLDDAIKLAVLSQSVNEGEIKRGIINKDNVFFGSSPDGLSILIPIPDDIHNLRDEIFATTGILSPQTPGNVHDQMKAEAAKVSLYNGSGVAGLAVRGAEFLRSQGVNIVQAGDASESYSLTTIIDHTGNPFVIKFLVDLLKIPTGKIQIQFEPNSSADVEIYLGADVIQKNLIP